MRFNRDSRRCAVAGRGLEDAWEDRLSVDVYLWREDCFHSHHLGLLLMRCLVCTAFLFTLSVLLSLYIYICVCWWTYTAYRCVYQSVYVKYMAYAGIPMGKLQYCLKDVDQVFILLPLFSGSLLAMKQFIVFHSLAKMVSVYIRCYSKRISYYRIVTYPPTYAVCSFYR